MELAEKLCMTKAEVLMKMSSYELTEWIVLYQIRAEERGE
jgi:hypothetical protein